MVIRIKRPHYGLARHPAPNPAPAAERPAPPPAPSDDVPPNLPFLEFDSIAGRGGMAVVWRAWHRELKIWVAVKVLDGVFTESETDLRQFLMESRMMTDLHHPNIVQGYGADCVDGRYYFVMEYVDGYTLGSLLERGKRLSEEEALIVCETVANAMDYAWTSGGVVHCDIKPENLMLNSEGDVKVMDLGLCRPDRPFRRPADGSAEEDEVIGTPAYISPEQIYCTSKLDCRADIYSLGATLYHLVTGRVLFPDMSNDDVLRAHVDPASQAPDPRRFAPELSDGFCRLLANMLVKDRPGRLTTWELVAQCAAAAASGLPVPVALSPVTPSSIALD